MPDQPRTTDPAALAPEEPAAEAHAVMPAVRRRRRAATTARRGDALWGVVLPVAAVGFSAATPAVQFATATKTPAAMAVLTIPTTIVAVVAAILWLVAVVRGALYVGQRLLTLPSRLRASAVQTLGRASVAHMDAEHQAELRAALAEEQRAEYRSEWKTWFFLAAGQVTATIFLFAFWYWLLGTRDTTASCAEKPCDGHFWWNSVYLSTVTITTLGYGDVLPLGASRILAGMEALTGLLYTGVFIAGLARVLETTDVGADDEART